MLASRVPRSKQRASWHARRQLLEQEGWAIDLTSELNRRLRSETASLLLEL
ncbi:hypothetical protein O9993_02965 [Vibrio lentus]|nr:hypothetical protein [Vibrio lentus]